MPDSKRRSKRNEPRRSKVRFNGRSSRSCLRPKKARDEARRAMIISTALNQNMSSLDPKTQEDLQQLLQAEARRVRQENFEWKVGLWIGGIVVGGFILFFLMVVGIGS